jgi:hypothetical protein
MFETPCLGAQVMLTKKRERAIMKQADQWTALDLTKGLLIAFSGDLECCLHALGSLESTKKCSAMWLSTLLVAAEGFEPPTKGL